MQLDRGVSGLVFWLVDMTTQSALGATATATAFAIATPHTPTNTASTIATSK